jgi:hypothetical protein
MYELLSQLSVEFHSIAIIVLAAFAGGAFGAAIGALPAFCLTGVVVIAGEAADSIHTASHSEILLVLSSPVTGGIGFGPILGPHVAFAGGAAAAAFAAKYHPSPTVLVDGDYHPAKNIARALGPMPSVMFVGGLFGIFGTLGIRFLMYIQVPWDPLNTMVVLSAILHRLMFNYPIVRLPRGLPGSLDMSPFAEGVERSYSITYAGSSTRTEFSWNRNLIEPWLPHQYEWSSVTMIGLVAGLLGGYVALITNSPFLAFGISAASLIFLALGIEKIPVTHHITLPASTATIAVLNDPTGTSQLIALVTGGVFGIIGALFGEFAQRIFYAHSDTHLDPPAVSIVFTTFLISIFAALGIFHDAAWLTVVSI